MRAATIRAFAIVCLLALSALGAQAGPWPREQGTTFLSYAVEIDKKHLDKRRTMPPLEGTYFSLYGEHGLRNDLTLGLDAGVDALDLRKAIAFLRWPIGDPNRATRKALEVGIGTSDGKFALRPGFSWGRGVQIGKTDGWLGIDSRATLGEGLSCTFETDLTFGLKPSDKAMVILQLQSGLTNDRDAYAKIAPSYVRQIGKGRHLEIGGSAGLHGTDAIKIKLGLWHSF